MIKKMINLVILGIFVILLEKRKIPLKNHVLIFIIISKKKTEIVLKFMKMNFMKNILIQVYFILKIIFL